MPLLNTADAVRLGASPADAVYLGADQVWSPVSGVLPLEEQIAALNPEWWFKCDDASGDLVNSGSETFTLPSHANILYQQPIGSLLGVGSSGNASTDRTTTYDYRNVRPGTFLWFNLGTTSTYPIGYGRWPSNYRAILSREGDVQVDTSNGVVTAFPPGIDRSGIWMRAVTVDTDLSEITVWDNGQAGTPEAIGSWPRQNPSYHTMYYAQGVVTCHNAYVQGVLTSQQIADLWAAFQTEGA